MNVKWQSTMMDCDACGYEWAAVHPVVAEYLECPVCHHMTPAPYIEETENMNARIEQLKQLATATWDGNLISKSDRDELVKAELAQRGYGWNWITEKGVKYLVDLGLLKA